MLLQGRNILPDLLGILGELAALLPIRLEVLQRPPG